MIRMSFPRPRFSLRSLFVLMLGIAIGYSLNLATLRILLGPRASLPSIYVIEPPDVLDVRVGGEPPESFLPVSGRFLVGPDGRINLPRLGSIYLAGKTIDEAQKAIEKALSPQGKIPQVYIDVFASNSKKYYIITQYPNGTGTVVEVPITGNDTVLDAIAQIGGLKAASSTKVWIARPAANGVGGETVLPVSWDKIARGASAIENHQLMPGDRVNVDLTKTTLAPN
jgi:protein involved in polysaccharide export with SLBB domain